MVALFYPGEGLEPAWRLDYRNFDKDIPGTLTITGMGSGPMKIDVTLSNLNPAASLPTDLFRIDVPPSSQPIAMSQVSARRLFGAR